MKLSRLRSASYATLALALFPLGGLTSLTGLTGLTALTTLVAPQAVRAADPDPAQVTIAVASLLEQVHYSKQRLGKEISRKLLRNYLETLDYNHLFLTREDVEEFTEKWADSLDSEIIFGRTKAAVQMHQVFRQRVEERVAYVKELLASELDFNTDHTIELNRQKASWPAAGEESHRLWKDRITSELIQERQNKSPKEPVVMVGKRYDQYLKDIKDQTEDEVVKLFLLSLARTYDPHSDYMSKSDQEQFNISMRLSLFGIGARLRAEDGYTKIEQLIPGGPASRIGKIKAGDRIVGVAQADGEFVDCVDMKLDKVVSMIRGDKDTLVRLQLIPVGATNGSDRTVVEIKRDEIKLKEGDARGELIEWTQADGKVKKLGYIDLPSFYRDFSQNGNPNAKSTTRDVLLLLNRLKKEGIEGLVMDFRRDGGGSLEEAINLSGLFIKDGPVVQVKNWNGDITVNRDTDPSIAYDGPMVVLVNRQSASASEIFAAAMQDYGRAVIVGDSKTFGKGTVQQMIELAKAVPSLANGGQAGAVKLTIQKFYRIAGGSTQLRGVESDITLPSMSDQPEMGESALKDPLPYDTIKPLDYSRWSKPLFLEELKKRTLERIPKNPEFAYVQEDLERVRKYVEENKISTNEESRKAEVEKDKERRKKRDAERLEAVKGPEPKAYRITLDNASKPELAQITFVEPKPPKEGKDNEAEEEEPKDTLNENGEETVFKAPPIRYDPVKAEGLNILGDFVEMTKSAEGRSAAR